METNYQHYFGTLQKAQDTLSMAKYQDHPRPECREFKGMFNSLNQENVMDWLAAECKNPKW